MREKIANELQEFRDPETREKIIEKVLPKEKVWHGKGMDKMPDLYIQPKRGYTAIATFGRHITSRPIDVSGTHTQNGIFLAYGHDIKSGEVIEGAKIIDIAPTILHISGLSIPNDMDGKVLREIFKEESEPARRPVIYEEPEKEKIRRKIKDSIRRI